jgi:signal transduction histidine kinase/ligand-binding sensor domain-containing protein
MKTIAILIQVFLLSSLSLAQAPPINFYKITNEEGLSQASVNILYKDKDGFLWIGTDDGLNRFDGKKIKTFYYQFNDSTTMAANEVYGICEDKYNRLWIGHYNAGISIYDKSNDRFIRLDNRVHRSNRLSTNRVYGLAADSKGFIWARTLYGISKIDPGNFSIENFDDSSFSDLINTVHIDIIDFADHIWFGSKTKGLLRVTRDGKKAGLGKWDINQHGASISGIWVDNSHQLLVASEKGLFRVITTNNDVEIEPVIEDSVLFLSSSKLFREKNTAFVWVATEQGILVIDTDQKKLIKHIKSETVKDNLISKVVYCLLQDDEQNIIIGTNRGINIYSPFTSLFNNYENIFRKIPNFGHPVYAIHELKNRDLLIGTKNGGAWYFKTNSFKATSIQIPYSPARDIKVYHFTPISEKTFLMCSSKGIWELQIDQEQTLVQQPKKYPELRQFAGLPITDVVFANDSIAYIAGFTDGFFKWNYKKGSLRQYKKDKNVTNKGPVANELLNIVEAKDNNLVLCTKSGFSIYYPGSDSFLNVLPGTKYPYELPGRNIKDAYDDGTDIWLATFGAGVQKYNKQTHLFSGYTIKEGLPNNSVYAVIPDNKGNIWLPTNNGLAVLNIRTRNIKTFTTDDGLPDNEFNAYASYRAASGNIFFSTLNGIVNARPELIADNPYPPKIALTYLEAYSKEKDSVFNIYNTSEVTVPAGFNSLYFQFAALSYAAPAKNQYKIKLENFDKDWIELKNQNVRRYTNLTPGWYIFRVMGSNNSGKWSDKPFFLKIYITPFWYQTWWFKVLVVLAVAAVLYTLYRYRITQILRVERLRRKISSDLHDDIGSTLSSINIYSELAKKEKNNGPYIETIQQHTQNIIGNLDDLVWSINPKNDTISVLAERMKSFAEPFLTAKNIACNFVEDVHDTTLAISLEQRQHIYLAFKEMVNNVVKHSDCRNCQIQFLQKGKQLFLSVMDDGKGFNIKTNNNHRNGLKNLSERAKQLRGVFLVESIPGEGSKVKLEIRL